MSSVFWIKGYHRLQLGSRRRWTTGRGTFCSAGENYSKKENNRWRWRQKPLALDPFALDEKDRQSSRATIATFAPALSFDMTKTKRIACSGLSEDGKNLIWHLNDRRCCRRKLQHQLNQIHSYGVVQYGELHLDGYNIFRCDRCGWGSGVLLATKS